MLGHRLLLSDRGIKKAIEKGRIKPGFEIGQKTIQPASLDVNIGRVRVYTLEHMTANVREVGGKLDRDQINSHFKLYKEGQDVTIPSQTMAEIYIKGGIDFSFEDYFPDLELRSSRGRLGLMPVERRIDQDDDGQFVQVRNESPNNIILEGSSRFMQLFFHPQRENLPNDGYTVTDPGEAKEIADSLGLESNNGFVIFRAGDWIKTFKKVGTVDTREKGFGDDLYDTHELDKEGFTVPLNEMSIVQLDPEIELPKNIGIRLLPNLPQRRNGEEIVPEVEIFHAEYFGADNNYVNAGWIDPGYKGKLTGNIFRRVTHLTVTKGMPIGVGRIYRYNEDVERPYGHESLESNYQNSNGAGSRS